MCPSFTGIHLREHSFVHVPLSHQNPLCLRISFTGSHLRVYSFENVPLTQAVKVHFLAIDDGQLTNQPEIALVCMYVYIVMLELLLTSWYKVIALLALELVQVCVKCSRY